MFKTLPWLSAFLTMLLLSPVLYSQRHIYTIYLPYMLLICFIRYNESSSAWHESRFKRLVGGYKIPLNLNAHATIVWEELEMICLWLCASLLVYLDDDLHELNGIRCWLIMQRHAPSQYLVTMGLYLGTRRRCWGWLCPKPQTISAFNTILKYLGSDGVWVHYPNLWNREAH